MKKTLYLLIIVLLFGNLLIADSKKEQDDKKKWLSFVFDTFLKDMFPGGEFYTSVIENYFPETTSIIEESNGFALIDNPKVYFEGDSFTQFNWYFNDLDIGSSLNDGSPGVILPLLSVTEYNLHGQTPFSNIYGLNQLSKYENNGSHVQVSTIYSNMGSFSDWSQFFINTPATERSEMLSVERRKPLDNYYLNYQINTGKRNKLKFSLTYYDIVRQFNDFNEKDTVFEETGRMLMASLQYRKVLNNGYIEAFSVFNNIDRSNVNAELGVYPQETIDLKRMSIMAGFKLKKSVFDFALWFMYENEDKEPFTQNYSKDLMDNDGSGFIMPSEYGEFRATTLFSKLNIPIDISGNEQFKLKAFADLKYSKNEAWETVNDYNLFNVNKTSYLIREWESGTPYMNNNLNLKFGFMTEFKLSDSLELYGKLYFQKSDLSFTDDINNMSFFALYYDVGILLFPKNSTSILISYGLSAYDIRTNVSGFAESNSPTSIYSFWNDRNGDMAFQENERGGIYGYSGGKYHFVSEDIKAPRNERLLVSLNTKLSKNYRLFVKGMYKRIKNSFWVNFDKEYGFYKGGNEGLYYFDKPFKDYYLTNSTLEDDPFSLQLLINFIGKKEQKWFFSFSFLAHMGMGNTSFGNGYNNDIGIIDESMANPNTWRNGFGRLDGERGFVSKLNYGLFLFKNFSIGLNLKYRDGNPFTFMKMSNDYNQWVIYYKTIKGEDSKGKKGGPREDYLADVNIKINYKFNVDRFEFNLGFSFFNIFDVGYELSEMVFTDEDDRFAAELQIPRSIRLSLSVKF